MCKAERKMTVAVVCGEPTRYKDTEVEWDEFNYRVSLQGRKIAMGYMNKRPRLFSLCGRNTVATRSRLRALGVNIVCKDYQAYYVPYSPISTEKVDMRRAIPISNYGIYLVNLDTNEIEKV